MNQDSIAHAIKPLITNTISSSLKSSITDSKSFVIKVLTNAGNDHNNSNCLLIQGIKDMNKSKNENALEAQVKINKIFENSEVKAEIVNLHKLGSYTKFKAHPDKPRVTFVEAKTLGMEDSFLLEQKQCEGRWKRAVFIFDAP